MIVHPDPIHDGFDVYFPVHTEHVILEMLGQLNGEEACGTRTATNQNGVVWLCLAIVQRFAKSSLRPRHLASRTRETAV